MRYFVESGTGVRQELTDVEFGNRVYDWIYDWLENNLGDETELGSEFYDWAGELQAEIEEAAKTRDGFCLGEDTVYIDGSDCECCRMEPNGDIPKDRKDVFNFESALFNIPVWLSGTICRNRLTVMLAGERETVLYREAKINFCPMCGRRLA